MYVVSFFAAAAAAGSFLIHHGLCANDIGANFVLDFWCFADALHLIEMCF